MGLGGSRMRKEIFAFLLLLFFLKESRRKHTKMLTGVYQNDKIINGFNFLPISLGSPKFLQ